MTPKQAAKCCGPVDELLDPELFKSLCDPTRLKLALLPARFGKPLVWPLALLVAVPAWAALARRFGTVNCYLVALVAMIATAAALFPAVLTGNVAAVLAVTGMVGVFYTGLQLLPLTLLPETVREDAGRSGQAQAGTFTGLWTGLETGAMALGPGLFSVVLAVTAFRSSDVATAVVQPGSALFGLSWGFTLMPAALFLVSLVPLLAFRKLTAVRERSAV
jgi:glycoside/pentoside/hexuronide:cation symporter, GPH family